VLKCDEIKQLGNMIAALIRIADLRFSTIGSIPTHGWQQ
jgi:hypothetical protein